MSQINSSEDMIFSLGPYAEFWEKVFLRHNNLGMGTTKSAELADEALVEFNKRFPAPKPIEGHNLTVSELDDWLGAKINPK
jgi:hypothetical protein